MTRKDIRIKGRVRLAKQVVKKRVDQRILAYLVCVMIASTLWFLNALDKEYTTEVQYPVHFTNIPDTLYQGKELPRQLTIRMTSKGFTLLRNKLQTSFQPIEINVGTFWNRFVYSDNSWSYSLPSSYVLQQVSKQMSTNIHLDGIHPERIDIKLERARRKKVPIIPLADYELKNQHTLKGEAKWSPDSVSISGPSHLIDTIDYVETQPFHLGIVANQSFKKVELKTVEGVNYSTTSTEYHIDVEQYTEIELSVPVKAKNVPDSLTLILLPKMVTMTCNVGLSYFDKVKASMFKFEVDYHQTKRDDFLNVNLVTYPAFISGINYTPQRIEYIIERN